MLSKTLASNVVFLFAIVAGLNAPALTLEGATAKAFTNSHELKALNYEVESARAGETIAFAGYLPKLQVTGQHLLAEHFMELELNFMGQDFVIPSIQPYTDVGVMATLDLFNGFETVNMTSAARANREAAEHTKARSEESLRAQIRTLFYKALGSRVLVDVADLNVKTLEGHLNDVTARVRSGVSTRFDTLRVEVQLEEARTEKLAAESNVAVTRARLFQALGTADDGAPLEGTLPEDFSHYDTAKLSLNHINREDRRAAELAVETAADSAKAARSHWYPKVTLFGSHEYYNNYNHSIWESDERFKSQSLFGLQLRWNLFDGGAALASQRRAALAEQIAAERLAQFDEAVPEEFEESKRRFDYNVTNYKVKVSSVKKAEEAVRLARGGLRAGARTNTEVLDSVVDLNRARAALVKSQIDAVDALGVLELTLGRTL